MEIRIVHLLKSRIAFYGVMRGNEVILTAHSMEGLITAVWRLKRQFEARAQAALDEQRLRERKEQAAQDVRAA